MLTKVRENKDDIHHEEELALCESLDSPGGYKRDELQQRWNYHSRRSGFEFDTHHAKKQYTGNGAISS